MNFSNNLKNKADSYNNKRKIKNSQKFYDNMVNSSNEKATEVIFNKSSLAWLIVIVTLLLQLISLATTYKGSIVYFGGVDLPFNISAPLLFAISIQLIVFCVSHTIRLNFKKGLVLVLLMATLCSTYFSYIGIYNYINSPINYLEERYKQISNNISDKYDVVKETTKGNMTNTTLDIVNSISTSYVTLNMEIEKNNSLSEQIANITIDNSSLNSQTGSVSKPNIYNYGNNLDQYYADMAKYNAAIGNMVSDTTLQESDLKTQLYNAEVSSILGGKNYEDFISESIETESNHTQIVKGINNLYGLINTENTSLEIPEKLTAIQDYCQNYIQGISGEKDVFTTLLLNLNSLSGIGSDTPAAESLQNQINEFIVINKKDAEIIKSYDTLKANVYESATGNTYSENALLTEANAMELYSLMNSEINSSVYTLNQILDQSEQIDINSDDFVMHNLYVLPVVNLINESEGRSMAWFCLLFAILIDGLTLVFAIMEGRERTPLFAKSTKEIMGSSKETMENLLMTSLLSDDIQSKDEQRVENTLLKLKRFISSFNIITETMDTGYSMYCPVKELKDFQVFLATLCQFNLATIVNSKDLCLENTELQANENYVLVKSKFVVWANDKIVSLTLNNQYIESLNTIDDNYLMNGEML